MGLQKDYALALSLFHLEKAASTKCAQLTNELGKINDVANCCNQPVSISSGSLDKLQMLETPRYTYSVIQESLAHQQEARNRHTVEHPSLSK